MQNDCAVVEFSADFFNEVQSTCLTTYRKCILDLKKNSQINEKEYKSLNGLFHALKGALKKINFYEDKNISFKKISTKINAEILSTAHLTLSSNISTLLNSYQYWKIELSVDEVYFLVKALRFNQMMKQKLQNFINF